MPGIVLLGRILFALIFVLSGFSHFTEPVIRYAASQGVPYANFLVPFSGLLAILGGLSIALGYYAKIGAWLLVAFLVPITLKMHAFWDMTDPALIQVQRIMFMKNLSMLGGAFAFAYFGSGPYSLQSQTSLMNEKDVELELYPTSTAPHLDHLHGQQAGLTRGPTLSAQEKRMERRDKS